MHADGSDEGSDEAGATMVEYGVLLVGIALIVAAAATLLGDAAAVLYQGVMAFF